MTAEHTFDGDSWEFPARLDRVVDGDTFDLEVDVGFNMRRTVRVRLFGVDTAEVNVSRDSDEYRRGQEHKAFVEQWFMFEGTADTEWPLDVVTLKDKGKYGRYIAVIRGPGGESLTKALTEEFEEL